MKEDKLSSIEFLRKNSVPHRLIRLHRPPQNAQDIVKMYGCELGQVIKTLLFVGDKNVLVCIPGDRKVSISKLLAATETSMLKMATAKQISDITGLVIGGVCPFLRISKVLMVLDISCLKHQFVNIGAGTTTLGIEIASADLERIWPGVILDVAE